MFGIEGDWKVAITALEAGVWVETVTEGGWRSMPLRGRRGRCN